MKEADVESPTQSTRTYRPHRPHTVLSVFGDIAIHAWKLNKLLKPAIIVDPWPRLSLRDPQRLTEGERVTATLDDVAMLHAGLVIYPAVVGTAIYALLHFRYTSWWSWFISSAADAVCCGGGLEMIDESVFLGEDRDPIIAHFPSIRRPTTTPVRVRVREPGAAALH